MRRFLLPVAVLSATCLPAQTAPRDDSPVDSTVDHPQVLLDTVGPDGWRVRLGPTNLGSMLESERGRALWQPRLQPLLGAWEQLVGSEAEFAASRTRMLNYGGRIRVGLWFDAEDRRGAPPACIAVALGPDGRSDLAAIAKDLRRTLYEALPGEWAELELDDTPLTVRRQEDLSVTAPRLEGDSVLIAASRENDLPKALQRARSLAKAATVRLAPNSPAARLEIDFATLVAVAMANAESDSQTWMKATGLQTLDVATMSLSTAGPRVMFEYELKFTDDERGLFSALMPATKTVPTLLPARPEAGSWVTGHLDFGKFYQVMFDGIVASGEKTAKGLRAENRQELGIDFDTDLLAHMTDEVMLWVPESGRFLDTLFSRPWVFSVRLRDQEAFRKGLFTMLPNVEPFFRHRDTGMHGEVEVHRYGNEMWLAVGRGVFVFASGKNAEQKLGTVLDGCKELPATLPPDQALPADFAELERYLPPGYHGCAVGDAKMALGIPDELMGVMALFRDVPDLSAIPLDLSLDRDERKALEDLLREHELHIARGTTGYADRTWRWRTFW